MLLRSNWFDRDGGFPLPTGDVEPLTGRSYQQVAMASRSLHRSQDMGMLQPPGPAQTGAMWVDGGGGPDQKELFAGIDTRLSSIAAEIPDPSRRAKAADLLDRVEKSAVATRERLSPARLSDAAPPIAAMLADLRAAPAEVLLSELQQPPADPLAAVRRRDHQHAGHAKLPIQAAAVLPRAEARMDKPHRCGIVQRQDQAFALEVWLGDDDLLELSGGEVWRQAALGPRGVPELRQQRRIGVAKRAIGNQCSSASKSP